MKNSSLYIHWPFCASKCPYCDFNSHVIRDIDLNKFADAYFRDFEILAEILNSYEVSSVYFGGGTPSLMPISVMEKILNSVFKLNLSKDIEITIECNPTSFEVEKFRIFQEMGINRISLGIQSFCNDSLKFLGRNHDAKTGIYAIENARKIFDRYSFDLIYALPNQTLFDLEKELKFVDELIGDHISLYQLTIEENTQFYNMYKQGKLIELNDEIATDMYEYVDNFLKNKDIHAYEVSNYAKEGQHSRHNMSYWEMDNYIGIGPGAYSRIYRGYSEVNYDILECKNVLEKSLCGSNGFPMSFSMIPSPKSWAFGKNGHNKHGLPIESCEYLTERNVIIDAFITGLRTINGVNLAKLSSILGSKFDIDKNILIPIYSLEEEGFISIKENFIYATERGKRVLNSLVSLIDSRVFKFL